MMGYRLHYSLQRLKKRSSCSFGFDTFPSPHTRAADPGRKVWADPRYCFSAAAAKKMAVLIDQRVHVMT